MSYANALQYRLDQKRVDELVRSQLDFPVLSLVARLERFDLQDDLKILLEDFMHSAMVEEGLQGMLCDLLNKGGREVLEIRPIGQSEQLVLPKSNERTLLSGAEAVTSGKIVLCEIVPSERVLVHVEPTTEVGEDFRVISVDFTALTSFLAKGAGPSRVEYRQAIWVCDSAGIAMPNDLVPCTLRTNLQEI